MVVGGQKREESAPRLPERPAGRIRTFEDLEIFRRAMALVRPIDELVKRFPAHEHVDLAQQMRRASKSIPTNIAEGFSRRLTARDFKLYLAHALGSANEMVVHLMIASELRYAPASDIDLLIDEYRIIARQTARLAQVWRDPRERETKTSEPGTIRPQTTIANNRLTE